MCGHLACSSTRGARGTGGSDWGLEALLPFCCAVLASPSSLDCFRARTTSPAGLRPGPLTAAAACENPGLKALPARAGLIRGWFLRDPGHIVGVYQCRCINRCARERTTPF